MTPAASRRETASLLFSSIAACAQLCACVQMLSQWWQSAAEYRIAPGVPPTNPRPNAAFITHAIRPLAPTATRPIAAQPPGGHEHVAEHRDSVGSRRSRASCARTTARTDPKLDTACSWASRSLSPAASPSVTDSRR